MGGLTTHVLDTSNGIPANDVCLKLYRLNGTVQELITEAITNEDGRTDSPLLTSDDMKPGLYRIDFEIAAYFSKHSECSENPFLDIIPIQFIVSDITRHFHVPLLVSPYGYSTYRGS
ncbi:hydroxyisourate hydrolase [Thiomicrorhabdus indica]|uniref:hydroxyisourate hydrolase n=1 Tax=Thiomicrorhabdus indica TaxID=2267253 RepID=UPI002AA851F6|nr:hydroxyisourate hydrolase [Thiomicrorhabdus indica]